MSNLFISIEISDAVFDAIDGKAQIFTSTPTPPYYVGDLWVQGSSGDILHCVTSKSKEESYSASDWIKSSKYTDDAALNSFISGEYADDLTSIGDQIDGKARSWYQNTDPSLTWNTNEDHEGDLWYNSSSDSQNTYIYANGAWKQTSVPKELFDTIDGIASIYVTIPDNPVVGDLLIPASDIGTYKAGKVYRYNGSSWNEIAYTDDTVANEALEKAKQGLLDAAEGISLANAAQTAAGNAHTRAENAETNAKNYADEKDAGLSTTLTNAYQNYTTTEVGKLDAQVAKYFGLGGNTIIGDNYVISPYLGGGYLNITNTSNNARVIIDPNNLTQSGYIFQVHNGSKITMAVDTSGNAVFSGSINVNDNFTVENDGKLTATYGSIGGLTIGTTGIRYCGGVGNGIGIWKGDLHKEGDDYIVFHAGVGYPDIDKDLTKAPFKIYQTGALKIGSFDVSKDGALKIGSFSVKNGGSISASTGKIGTGWEIEDRSLKGTFEGDTVRLYPEKLELTKADGTVKGVTWNDLLDRIYGQLNIQESEINDE